MTLIQRFEGPACGCKSLTGTKALISVDDALAIIARISLTLSQTERVPLARASGRTLAQSVRSLGCVPPFDNAAMDGYAINTASFFGAGPWVLEVAGRIAAGQSGAPSVPASAAVQIFTGAPVPAGADAVVMQEDVEKSGASIRLDRIVPPGTNIRRAGEDIAAGITVLPFGTCLSAKEIAACAAAGHSDVCVTRRPRIALLVTGDEVVQAGQRRSAAGIWDINTPMLTAAIATPEIEFCGAFVAADTRAALRTQLQGLTADVDLIVTTGGISVGEEDHVKPAVADLGGTILFSGVAMKPGKPVSFGKVGRAHWIGLPGNPLSAFVTWQVFGTAICAALAGKSKGKTARRHVVLSGPLMHRVGRCEFRLARLTGFDAEGREVVDFPDATHSGRVAQLPDMDGLLFIPADAETLPPGALVEFQPF